MKIYLVSLGAGLLVGVIYGLLNVRSPAPPVVALIGLLGILLGEQLVPLAKRLLAQQPVTAAWTREHCAPILRRSPSPRVNSSRWAVSKKCARMRAPERKSSI